MQSENLRAACLLRGSSRLVLGLVGLLVASLGLAGCAGDGNDNPSPTVVPTASPSLTRTPTSTATLSPSPVNTATSTVTSTNTDQPTRTPSPLPSATNSVAPSHSPTASITATITPTATATASVTPAFEVGSCNDPVVIASEPLCALDSAPFICDFLVPEHCLLPFPSSAFLVDDVSTTTGLRVHYPLEAMPENIRGKHIDPKEHNTLDGFSPGAMIMTLFPQGVDLVASAVAPLTNYGRSLDVDSPTVLIDAATLEHVPHFVELDAQAEDSATSAMIIRPATRLREGHRYVVAIRSLVDAQGQAISAQRPFRILRDTLETPVQAINARRAHFEDNFQILGAAGVTRSNLIIAWDFTVASTPSLTSRALSVRDQGLAINGPGAPDFAVTSVEENVDENVLRRVQGTFQVPLFMTGTTPFAVYNLDAAGVPQANGFMTANFLVNIPRSTVAGGVANPARVAVYGHGLFGSRNEVNAGHLRSFSNQYNIMLGGTEWIGMSSGDPEVVQRWINDLSFFPRIADRLQQAMLNFILLERLFLADDGFAAHPAFQLNGVSLLDRQEVYYYGISQGGIEGGVYLALSPSVKRGVLGVGAANYSTLLQRSIDFDPFQFLLNQWYAGDLNRVLLYPLLQQLWDRGEPNGYISHLVSDPLPNTAAKKILMQVGRNDSQVSNVASEYEARSMGISTLVSSAVPAFGIAEVSAPFDGSAYVPYDVGGIAGPTVNKPPTIENGVHEAVRRLTAARQQIDAFLRPEGSVQDFCGGPCRFTNVPDVITVEPTPEVP